MFFLDGIDRIVDSLLECGNCSDSNVCMTSVSLVNDLVTSLDQLSRGHGLSDNIVVRLHKLSTDFDSKCCYVWFVTMATRI